MVTTGKRIKFNGSIFLRGTQPVHWSRIGMRRRRRDVPTTMIILILKEPGVILLFGIRACHQADNFFHKWCKIE